MSDPVEAEAQGVEMASVEWRGITFEIPRYRIDWPFDAVVAAEQEQWPTMLRALLPAEALMEFRALQPTQRDAFDLLDAIGKALGFADKGESPASAV